MSFDDWAELMEDSPGGDNHGRKRVAGASVRLDRAAHEFAESRFEYLIDVEIHGLVSTYNRGCRCPSCRRAIRDYRRVQRKK